VVSVRKGLAKTEKLAQLTLAELHPDGPVRCDGFCEDPRRLRHLKAQLREAERDAALLKAKLAQQASMERRLWGELWKTPQAAMWEKLAWGRDVAQYVRHKVRAEAGSLDDAKEARQWSDRLGLNPLAMLRLRWETERTEDAEARGKQRRERPAPPKPSSKPATDPRSILRAVN
jgi:hypothetical protein